MPKVGNAITKCAESGDLRLFPLSSFLEKY